MSSAAPSLRLPEPARSTQGAAGAAHSQNPLEAGIELGGGAFTVVSPGTRFAPAAGCKRSLGSPPPGRCLPNLRTSVTSLGRRLPKIFMGDALARTNTPPRF